MKEIVVDTSYWIEAFRGKHTALLEEALKGGRVVLPPLVLAELISGCKTEKQENKLIRFLSFIPLHPVGRTHWKNVGLLRAHLQGKGWKVSIPDCHIAQCALEMDGTLLTYDKVFRKIADLIGLKLAPVAFS